MTPDGGTAYLNNENTKKPKIVVDYKGTYKVSLIVNDGELYSEATNVTIRISAATGIEDETFVSNNILFYPNPVISDLNIRFSLETSRKVSINLTDLNGRVVYSSEYSGLLSGYHTIKLNLGKLNINEGVYSINMYCDEFVTTKRIVFLK